MSNIMSVAEARVILGDDAKAMSDEQIEKMIDDLDMIAKLAIRQFRNEQNLLDV